MQYIDGLPYKMKAPFDFGFIRQTFGKPALTKFLPDAIVGNSRWFRFKTGGSPCNTIFRQMNTDKTKQFIDLSELLSKAAGAGGNESPTAAGVIVFGKLEY